MTPGGPWREGDTIDVNAEWTRMKVLAGLESAPPPHGQQSLTVARVWAKVIALAAIVVLSVWAGAALTPCREFIP